MAARDAPGIPLPVVPPVSPASGDTPETRFRNSSRRPPSGLRRVSPAPTRTVRPGAGVAIAGRGSEASSASASFSRAEATRARSRHPAVEHLFREVQRRVRHAATEAARAEAAPLAGEGDQALVAAGEAGQSQKAVFEDAAAQVLVDFLRRELRQAPCFFGSLTEGRPVLLHDLVKSRVLRASTLGAPRPGGPAGGRGGGVRHS